MAGLDVDIRLARRAFDVRAELSVGLETLAVVGRSGAGKTSLLRTIAGLERPQYGRIQLDDDVWLDTERRIDVDAEHRRVGYLPQDYGLFPHLSVAANVRFAARRPRPDLLERLGVAQLADARPHQLSGGERQRAALARALAREPRLLLLDEPFGALDAISRQHVRDELRDILTDLALPTLIVTHAFADAAALAERVAVIDRGQLVQVASAAELLRAPATPTVAALTGANVLAGTATRNGTGSVVELVGGGSVRSAAMAEGPVHVVIQPWDLTIVDASTAALVDTVVAITDDRGGLAVRLGRLNVFVTAEASESATVGHGRTVGLVVPPEQVRVLPA